MQFQINGQEYFLGYAEEEHSWYVVQPTPRGLHRIPVYVDGPATGRAVAQKRSNNLSS